MTWLAEQGTYLSGQEAVDTLDLVAIDMERKWGADRLRLLVSEELRTKFDRQRLLTNDAITRGELPDVIRETKRMIAAWTALDREAERTGAGRLPPTVFETTTDDGAVIQVVRESELASIQAAENVRDGRRVALFTMEEIGRLLSAYPSLYATKEIFPGATVTAVRQSVGDPLERINA